MKLRLGCLVLACVAVAGAAESSLAQSSSIGPQSRESLAAQRQALSKMMKIMSVDYAQSRLESVLKNITDVTGAPLVILWTDDRNPVGLDKEAPITLLAENQTALTVLEMVLSQVTGDVTSGGNSWQMTEAGTIEVGPKERLNRTKRLEIYDIADLQLEIHDYSDVPQFDLNSALQSAGSGGGGGGQSPFSGGAQQNRAPQKTEQESADEVIRLIVEQVEPEQWTNNGGSGATVRYYKHQLLVTAPDYIQRQVNGYPFWPAQQTNVSQDKNGRKVSLLPPKGSGVVQTSKVSPGGATQPAPSSTAQTKPTEGH